MAAKSAKLCGARAPGNAAGKGEAVVKAVGANGATGTAPEGKGGEPLPVDRRLHPIATAEMSSAARKMRLRVT